MASPELEAGGAAKVALAWSIIFCLCVCLKQRMEYLIASNLPTSVRKPLTVFNAGDTVKK